MKRILVPIDFSRSSGLAAHYAVGIAKQLSATVEIVHVINIDPSTRLPNWKKLEEELVKSAQKDADLFMADLNDSGVTYKPLFGFPFQDVVEEHALKTKTDIIVMGSTGASGLKKLVGSNAAALIDKSQIPVLVVPVDAKFNGLAKIVYASDMTQLNEEIKPIARFTKPFDGELTVLHISNKDQSDWEDHSLLVQTLRRATGYDRIRFHEDKNENIAEGIEEFVTKEEPDLLIMFTHKLALYEKVFGKSVTRQLAHHNRIPLLAFNGYFSR
ncbi:universal stress protein UspA [Cytophagales bacterium WSM2-2]|nr:universal stress protein UspA [Cytophagales bacterium WSM2-2]